MEPLPYGTTLFWSVVYQGKLVNEVGMIDPNDPAWRRRLDQMVKTPTDDEMEAINYVMERDAELLADPRMDDSWNG